eukprot:jgi/Botrbrau1/22166/Bobra.0557s0001.1
MCLKYFRKGCTVKVNGEELSVQDMFSLTSSVVLPVANGSVTVSLSLFQAHHGTMVTIVSPSVKLAVSLVPPGLDHEGFWQDSHLNINATLLRNPRGTMQGVIGDTYHGKYQTRVNATAATVDSPETTILPTHLGNLLYPVLPDVAYELDHLFDKPAVVLSPSFSFKA